MVPAKEEGAYHFVSAEDHPQCPQLSMVRINGAIFFGAVDHVQNSLMQIDEINPQKKSVLIVARGISFVDVAGAEMLAQEARRRRKLGGGLYFYRCKDEIYKFLRKSDKLDDIGGSNFFPTMANWIKPVYAKLDSEICRNCPARIFAECHVNLPNGEARSPSPQSSPASGRGGEREGQFSNSGEPRSV